MLQKSAMDFFFENHIQKSRVIIDYDAGSPQCQQPFFEEWLLKIINVIVNVHFEQNPSHKLLVALQDDFCCLHTVHSVISHVRDKVCSTDTYVLL